MNLSKSEVARLAKLARLQLNETELDNFTTQLDEILRYLDKLAEIKIKPEPADVKLASGLAASVRDDEVKTFTSERELIKQAPHTSGDLLAVPPVFGLDE